MAIALIQKTPNTTAPALSGDVTALATGAFDSACGAGNLIVAYCIQYRFSGSVGAVTFSDNDSNTWYVDRDVNLDVARVTIGHCYAANAVALNVTATTSPGSVKDVGAVEYSGVVSGLTAGGSASNGSNGTSTSPSTNSLAGTGNNLYIGACLWDASGGSITCTPGQTQIHENENNTYMVMNSEYLLSSGAQTLTWTLASSKLWGAVGVAYAEASGGTTTYTVTYNGNSNTGGSVPADTNSPYASGSLVTVLGNTSGLIRTNYIWNGWNLSSDGSSTSYASGSTFNISQNTLLYAKWLASGSSGGILPSITLVNPSAFYHNQSGIIVIGNYFNTNSGSVSLNSNITKTGTNVIQKINSWSNTSINFTSSSGTLNLGNNYLFVTNESGTISSGSLIYLTSLPTSPVKTIIIGGQGNRSGMSDLNGGAFSLAQTQNSFQGTNGLPLYTVSGCVYNSTSGTLYKSNSFASGLVGTWVHTKDGNFGGWVEKNYCILTSDLNQILIGAGMTNNTNVVAWVGGAISTFSKAESLSSNGDTITETIPNGAYTTSTGMLVTLNTQGNSSGTTTAMLLANKRGNKQ